MLPYVDAHSQTHSENGIIEIQGPHHGAWPSGASSDGTVVVGISTFESGASHGFRWTQAGGMTDLGTLGGWNSSVSGVSADGSAVIGESLTGNSATHAFRWTATSGMVDLGTLDGGDYSLASSISANGGVVVGQSITRTTSMEWHAFRWTPAEGMTDLGTLGTGYSTASAVSADGRVVVGNVGNHAFRWTVSDGMVDLGAGTARAVGVSADGSVVIGDAFSNNGVRSAFRWTQNGGITNLDTLGSRDSYTVGLSADGSVVIGDSITQNGSVYHAFRWTQQSGMTDLGDLGGEGSSARAVSADGRVVVGTAWTTGNRDLRAFRWTQATGMQSIEDWLRANGVAVAREMTYNAVATSSDGSVVVGQTDNATTFVARVSGSGSGLVTLSDVQKSLYSAANSNAIALSFASTAINGAHSRPLSRRVAVGQQTFWMAGDWGRDDHGSRSGELGLAEAALGYNFGLGQVNLSLGKTWSQHNLAEAGSAKVEGTYVHAEALIPVAGNLWATLGAYGSLGEANLRRGYFNAGTPDHSTAMPSVKIWGVRTRLDWDSALHTLGTYFSPYVDLTYSNVKLDAYTETGGGFPARFDSQKDKSTELRLGVNTMFQLPDNVRLLGWVETAHRFERKGARTTGDVIGMFAFDLPGQSFPQDWVRVGTGLEWRLGGGKATLSANATTPGTAPSLWLAANWQLVF